MKLNKMVVVLAGAVFSTQALASKFILLPKASAENPTPSLIEFVTDHRTGLMAILRCDPQNPKVCDLQNPIGGREFGEYAVEKAIGLATGQLEGDWAEGSHISTAGACVLGTIAGTAIFPFGGTLIGAAIGCGVGATGARATAEHPNAGVKQARALEKYFGKDQDKKHKIVKFPGDEADLVALLTRDLAEAIKWGAPPPVPATNIVF